MNPEVENLKTFSNKISFLKKADIKGKPTNLKLDNKIQLLVNLNLSTEEPINRKSCP